MHVVQILPALDEGGVERGVVELNRELVWRGVESSVISSGGRLVAEIERDGGTHYRLPVKSKNPFSAVQRARGLHKLLKRVAPDLVHFRSRVPGWLFTMANRGLDLPFVTTVHGFNSVSRYSRIMTSGVRVICPSGAVADYIRKHYQTPDEVIRVIPRGIDPQVFDPQHLDDSFIREFRQSMGLNLRFVVLGVGRITPLKGYDLLIRATAEVSRELPFIRTVIVGSAERGREGTLTELQQLVEELGVGEHVVFAGNQQKMAEVYTCGNVLVSCNHGKPESFGRTMAEALAMGCPVVATRHGGALDIVREGVDGWLVEPGSVDELAGRLVEAARTHFSGLREGALERFALSKMVEGTLDVYREVLTLKSD